MIEMSKMKKKEYLARAANFAIIKKARQEQNRKLKESKYQNKSMDVLEELEKLISENKIAMKRLEEYKRLLEKKESEEKTMHELEKQLKIVKEENDKEDGKLIPSNDGIDEIGATEEEMKALEISIYDLSCELEKIEIDSENEWLWGVGLFGADL